jgi:predicted ATPase
MKLTKILLRWYKSFHFNYRGHHERGQATTYRPWNALVPKFAAGSDFPFIEIPVEDDISTIVGANESGKSHLLNAVSKVVSGVGLDGDEAFQRTDLCHFASIRTKNVEAWPNVGLEFEVASPVELAPVLSAIGHAQPETARRFALILAPEDGVDHVAWLYVEPNPTPAGLNATQLAAVRAQLPSVQFIDSRALLSSELAITQLLAAYGVGGFSEMSLYDRRAVQKAAQLVQSISLPANVAISKEMVAQVEEVKSTLRDMLRGGKNQLLELLLFRDILGITPNTLKYLFELDTDDRGYIEGQVAKWNEEILDKLNLSHFWQQDDQFSLTVNYKDGVIYFEIHDKTDSIYTFKERSSGLKFFLSYYIQAKAMEMSHRNKNSIIMMDEPDSALSILGQRNLLAVFESLVSAESSNETCQLIYTTHSPYLINRNFPRRVRVVKKEDAEEGSQYIEQARARRYEPVRSALGIDYGANAVYRVAECASGGVDRSIHSGRVDSCLRNSTQRWEVH